MNLKQGRTVLCEPKTPVAMMVPPSAFCRWMAGTLIGLPLAEAVVLAGISPANWRKFFSDAIQAVAAVCVATTMIRLARRLRSSASEAAAGWSLIAIANCFWALGMVAILICESVLQLPPYPGVPDVFLFAFYPFMVVGLWRLPREPSSARATCDHALDMGALTVLALVVIWHMNLRPLCHTLVTAPNPGAWTSMGYTLVDTALLLTVFSRLVRKLGQGEQFVPLLLLVIGCLFLITADLLHGYVTTYTTFASGTPIDLGWVLFSTFSGLAACGLFRTADAGAASNAVSARLELLRAGWTLGLTYLWILLVVIVLVWALFHRQEVHVGFLIAGLLAATLLAITRQFRMLRDNLTLARELQAAAAQLEVKVQQGFQGSDHDFTERKQAEDAWRKSEERMRLFFERQVVGMAITSPAKGWLQVNPRVCAMLGYSREELPQLTWVQLTHPEDIAPDLAQFNRLLAGEIDDYSLEKRFIRKDGTVLYTNLSVACVRHADGAVDYVLALLEDITRRKEAEAEIRRLNELLEQRVVERTAQLEAANKELESFSYSVSHDLRSPLRHITGYLKLLAAHAGETLDPEGQRLLATVDDAAKRMALLIDDLLAFSRVGRATMHLAPVQLLELVTECRQELAPDTKDRCIEWVIPPLPQVMGDRALLKQALLNLLANAIKYTRARAVARIDIGYRATETEWEFFVRDNGIGFDMKYSKKLFEVFQRLHSDAAIEGTGIGLANVRRVIVRHGGRTWAEGEVGRGAVFFFTLPKQVSMLEAAAERCGFSHDAVSRMKE